VAIYNEVFVLFRIRNRQFADESELRWHQGYLNANVAGVAEDVVRGETTCETSAPHDQRVIELPYARKQSLEPRMLFFVAKRLPPFLEPQFKSDTKSHFAANPSDLPQPATHQPSSTQ
jgi:hypothetical protein